MRFWWSGVAAFTFTFCFTPHSGCGLNSPDTSTYDKIWGHATLYKNEENSYLQKFALSGRIQPEGAWFDADQGDFSDEFLWRRFRFGFKSEWFRDWVLHIEGDFDLNGPFGNMYDRITDGYIRVVPEGRS